MSDTTFTSGVTIASSWLNDVNNKTYHDNASLIPYTQGGTGSVSRTVSTKLQEGVSVKDFGAVGDGVTDDTAAFTAAFATASVVVAPWTSAGYLLNSGFTIPTGKVLLGAPVETSSFGSSVVGDRGTVKLIANQSTFTGTAVVTLATRSGMAGITVYGTSGVDPIVIGSNSALAHVRAIKGRYGLNVSSAGGIVLTDVQADGNSVGMFSSSGGTDIQAVGCVFSNSTADGVLLNSGAGQVAFTNTRFEWNAGAGIRLFDVNGGVTFDGSCVFDRNGDPAARLQGITSNVIFGDGVRYSRNGAITSNAALQAHITLEGTGSNIKIGKGHWIATSITDNGLGAVLPNYVLTNAGTYSEVFLRDQPTAQTLGVFYDATTKSTLQRNPVVQVQEATRTTVGTGTTVFPVDDTIPQITEGDEYLTCSITPRRATNILVIDFEVPVSNSVTTWLIAALFRDSAPDALAVAAEYGSSAGGEVWLKGSVTVVAGATSATTFRLRCGGGAAGTTTVNGHGTFRYFGGAMKSTIRITEHEAY